MSSMYNEFTNKYNLMKTLRFGLIPQGKTLSNIEKNGILEEDFVRARERKVVQNLIDEYHKTFINENLINVSLDENDLREYAKILSRSGEYEDPEKAKAGADEVSGRLRNQVVTALTKAEGFTSILKADVIKDILPEIYKNEPDAMASLSHFDGFATYFTDYHTKRKLMYSAEDKAGTIGKRVINENFPIHVANTEKLLKAINVIPDAIGAVEDGLSVITGGKSFSDIFSLPGYSTFLTQLEIDRYNSIIGGYVAEDGKKIPGINEAINLYNQSKEWFNKLEYLTQLKKQILSDRTSFSFSEEPFDSDEELLEAMFSFNEEFQEKSFILDAVDDVTMELMDEFIGVRNKLNDEAKIKEERTLKRDKYAKEAIKNYLDFMLSLSRYILKQKSDIEERDPQLFSEMADILELLEQVRPLYNKTRNYLSGKPYSTEKVKLNFGSSVFLSGWAESQEKVKLGTILTRDGKYYLGIIAKGQGDLFARVPEAKTTDVYKKMKYNIISGANKMLPHVIFSAKGIERFKPDSEIMRIYRNGTFKKGKTFSLEDCHKLIDFYKDCIANYPEWDCFSFNFSDTKEYEDIAGFYHEVEEYGYSVKWRDIDAAVIDNLVAEGKLYLFELWHKDFSENSHGKPDLSTIYWRALFEPRNEDSYEYRLNGGAEMFFRQASIKDVDIIRHKAGEVVKPKSNHAEHEERTFDHDIVKDRRYTVDKFQLNVPITMNATSPDFCMMNTEAKLAIKRASDPHVIGVSRGENSLIHITVLDSKGNIVEQRNLNTIGNTDYAELLEKREAVRAAERSNWESLHSIKQLKEGYISQVVKILTDLMFKYNAVIAIEDLSAPFKQKRQKIEKAVYQQLEKALITKLNFLVNKDAKEGEVGDPFNAYQLTSPFQSFERIGRQTGFIFYVSPWNTTSVDSDTGFVNLFDTRYTSIAASKKFWHSFENISYDEKVKAYRFSFDYTYFVDDKKGEVLKGTNTFWRVYSHGVRTRYHKVKDGFESENINLTIAISELLERYSILNDTEDLRAAICEVGDREFHEELLKLFSLMVNLRNDMNVISPVMSYDNETFYTGQVDENGSYNIARKGLMIVNRIKDADEEALTSKGKGSVSLGVSNNEWLKEVQGIVN